VYGAVEWARLRLATGDADAAAGHLAAALDTCHALGLASRLLFTRRRSRTARRGLHAAARRPAPARWGHRADVRGAGRAALDALIGEVDAAVIDAAAGSQGRDALALDLTARITAGVEALARRCGSLTPA
jgi:hypothetical protein